MHDKTNMLETDSNVFADDIKSILNKYNIIDDRWKKGCSVLNLMAVYVLRVI